MDISTADRTAVAVETAEHWVAPLSVPLARPQVAAVTDRMHAGVFSLILGIYGVMMLSAWLIFATDAPASINMGICTAYFATYFGMPLMMSRLAVKHAPPPPAGSLRQFLGGELETWTGRISGRGAIVQILTIPAVVTIAFACIGIVLRLRT